MKFCICDGRTRAVSPSYIDRSRQLDVNWSRRCHRIGLFGGILYLRQWYDNRELVIHWFYGSREEVVTSVIGGKDDARAPGQSGSEGILLKVLKLCLQNDEEAKISINLDKLRNIVEVIEEGILVKMLIEKDPGGACHVCIRGSACHILGS